MFNTPGPLGWLASSSESGVALIYVPCYAILDTCENFCKNPDHISWRDITVTALLVCKSDLLVCKSAS